MFRIEFSPLIWLSMNFFRVASFASGNRFSAWSSLAAFCGVSPPRHADERVEVLRVRVQLVPRRCEIVTVPNGEPPVGGLKMPRTKNVLCAPLENVMSIGEPMCRSCLFA